MQLKKAANDVKSQSKREADMNEKAIEAKMSDLELNAPDGNDDHPAVQAFLNRKEKPAMTIPEQAVGELIFWYRNYRGEEGYRRVRPISLRFGRSDYHKEPQWLLRALDLEKNEQREFALADAKSVVGGPVLDFTAALPLVGVERALPPLRAREEIAPIGVRIPEQTSAAAWKAIADERERTNEALHRELDDMTERCRTAEQRVRDAILSRTAGQEWREPEGWQLVPKEPTPEMLDAADKREDDEPLSSWGRLTPAPFDEIYRAMLAAAPPVTEPIVAEKSQP